MSAQTEVERILQKNAVRPSGGCLPALLLGILLAAALWPPGALAATHWPRGNGASAVQLSQAQAKPEPAVSSQANAPAGLTMLAPAPVVTQGLAFLQVWNPDAGETHFRYTLRSGGPPAISYVEIELCTPRLRRVLVETPAGVQVEQRPGIVKIETATMGDTEQKLVTLVMAGAGWTAAPTAYRWKAGDNAPVTGETYGPQCTPTAVALAGFGAAPWDDQLGYYALLLLLLLGGIGALVVARVRIRGK